MSHIPELIEFGQVSKLESAGILYPSTVNQLQWMYRRRNENGLAEAFAVVNGRNCFKPRRFLELIDKRAAA